MTLNKDGSPRKKRDEHKDLTGRQAEMRERMAAGNWRVAAKKAQDAFSKTPTREQRMKRALDDVRRQNEQAAVEQFRVQDLSELIALINDPNFQAVKENDNDTTA